jgi:hypothetical protein
LIRRLACYLDRFEGETAVLLVEGREVAVHRSLLPQGASEGDHFQLSITPDPERRDATAGHIRESRTRIEDDGGER